MLALALPIKLGWLHGIFPYPDRLGYVLPMLLAINVGAGGIFIRAALDRHWLFDWLARAGGAVVGTAVLCGHRGDRYSAGDRRIHFIRFDPRRGALAHAAARSDWDFCLHRLAGGVSVSRAAAKRVGKSLRSEDARDGSWHRSSLGCRTLPMAVSQLEVCAAGDRSRDSFMDMAWRRTRSMFPWGAGAYAGGCDVVPAVSRRCSLALAQFASPGQLEPRVREPRQARALGALIEADRTVER